MPVLFSLLLGTAARQVSDFTSLGPRADRRGEAGRGCEVGGLPNATPDLDCRGDPARSEARAVSRAISERRLATMRPCGLAEPGAFMGSNLHPDKTSGSGSVRAVAKCR
jgi:hypothetical protein